MCLARDNSCTRRDNGSSVRLEEEPRTNSIVVVEEVPCISACELLERVQCAKSNKGASFVVVDVRVPLQFSICSLAGSINIPLSVIERDIDIACSFLRTSNVSHDVADVAEATSDDLYMSASSSSLEMKPSIDHDVFVLCRRGVDSEVATRVRLHRLSWSDGKN